MLLLSSLTVRLIIVCSTGRRRSKNNIQFISWIVALVGGARYKRAALPTDKYAPNLSRRTHSVQLPRAEHWTLALFAKRSQNVFQRMFMDSILLSLSLSLSLYLSAYWWWHMWWTLLWLSEFQSNAEIFPFKFWANVQDPNLRIDNRVVVRLKCGRAFVCSWSAHADDIRTGIFGLSLSIPIVHTIKIKLIRHLPGKRQMWKGEKVLLMRLLAHSCRVDKTKSGCDIVPRT